MVNPKPIKRNPAIVQFSKDHHFALLLIWKIRQGLTFSIDTIRINKYINFFFQNYLENHFKEEEELLFVHLDKNDILRKRVVEDHHDLRKFSEKLNGDADSILINEFTNKLEAHIRFEERELFNDLQKNITASDLKVICNKMASSHKNQIKDKWEDEFWIKKSFC